MASKMPISQFVAELKAALDRKDGYIMGSYGQNPRTGYLDLSVPESKCKTAWKPNGYYYNQYSKNEKQHTQALKWRKKCARVWDCNGMAEGIYEIFSGVCINSKARYNYSQWCNPKGAGMIPAAYRVPGAAVFWSSKPEKKPTAANIHHVAYLYKPVVEGKPDGDWYIIEAKGVMYGVVQSRLNSRKPNFWGHMTKYFDYGETPAPAPTPTPTPTKTKVEVTGNSVNVRSAPGTSNTRVLGVVHKGDILKYQDMKKTVDGRDWYLVIYKNENGWISSRYSKLV